MKSIVMCCVVLICATMVHGKNYFDTDEELELVILRNEIGRFIEEYDDILNDTQSLINYRVFSKISKLTTKPEAETLDQIKIQTVAAAKGGANTTHCYEAAKQNATTTTKHAFDAMIACGEEYKKIIEAYVTEEFKLLETACMIYLSFQKGINQTITDRLTALKNQYIESIKNIHVVALEGPLGNTTELDSCLGQFTPRLTADFQNVLLHASACISAS